MDTDEISFSGTQHKRRYLVCQGNIDHTTRCVKDMNCDVKSGACAENYILRTAGHFQSSGFFMAGHVPGKYF